MRADRGGLAGLLAAHSWLGLVSSWILALVFLTGAMTMFQREIDLWEKAPLSLRSDVSAGIPLDDILARTRIPATVRDRHVEILLPGPLSAYYHVFVYDDAGDYYRAHAFHSRTGREWPDPDLSYFGEFLEEFHKRLNLPLGNYLVGIATLVFSLNLVSGLVLHWPKLNWRSLIRPRLSRPRLRWLDLHNSLGIFGLPFALLMGFTGALFSFSLLFESALVTGRLGGDSRPLLAFVLTERPSGALTGVASATTGLDGLVRDASRRAQMEPTRISLLHHGDRGALLTVHGERIGAFVGEDRISYRLADRAIVGSPSGQTRNALATGDAVLHRLHYGDFGGIALRWFYFILAIGSCVLIATGNLLWLEKRLGRQTLPRGFGLVAGLSVGTCGGGMLALAGAMMAGRLVPADMPARSEIVIGSFFAILALGLVFALFGAGRPRKMLIAMLFASGGLYLLLPLLDWVLFGRQIVEALGDGDFAIVTVEVLLALLATACLAFGIWLRRDPVRIARPIKAAA